MEKKIEDYYPLYIGCEVQVIFNDELCLGRITGVFTQRGTEVQVIWNGHAMEEPTYFEFGVKPILRPLSDMTEQEYEDLCDLREIASKSKSPYSMLEMEAETVNHLRLLRFDVDKLIESGLAIDKSTLK